MHSWRVLLLPFLEQQSLYDQYDFREPWNGPNNSKLLTTMPSVFFCPSQRPVPAKSRTNYAVVTGSGTLFPGSGSVKFADVTDGPAETLMVVEVAHANVPWTAPIDLDVHTMSFQFNDPTRPGISSMHSQGAQVAFGDTAVYWLENEASATTLRAATTIAGGEKIESLEPLRAR